MNEVIMACYPAETGDCQLDYPVTRSEKPLVFDVLPVLKVRRYYGKSKIGEVYCYARMYFLHRSLQISLCAFEREPDDFTCIEFALGRKEDAILLFTLSRQQALLSLRCSSGSTPVGVLQPSYFSGVDEQGWYWGAQLALEENILRSASIVPEETFLAALFKTRTDEAAFGASCCLPKETEIPFRFERFSCFKAVDYQ